MMEFEALKQLDNSLKLVTGDVDAFPIESISHSEDPLERTFCFVKNMRFLNSIGRRSTNSDFLQSGLVLLSKLNESLTPKQQKELKEHFGWVATVDNIEKAMCSFSKPFHEEKFKNINYQVDGRQMGTVDIDPSAEVSQNVFLGENVTVGKNVRILPGSVVMPNSIIGDETIIFPNVTIYSFTEIGKNCRIHSGTIVGADGFGYNFIDGVHQKIWHLYGVKIGDDVEIGSNSMVDCGAFTDTVIGNGCKIDNSVQIAHNAKIGNHVIFCGRSGVSGSVEVGDYSVFGADAGSAPNVRLGKGVQIAARATISENSIIEDGAVLAGHPARPLKDWLRAQATLNKMTKK